MLELAPEDSPKLNIFFSQDVKSMRLNEATLTLCALLHNKDVKIQLSPTCMDSNDLHLVKELPTSQHMNTQAGFPVFVLRFSRIHQSGKHNLDVLIYNPLINQSDVAQELKHYLLEFLPFEIEATPIIHTVRLTIKNQLHLQDLISTAIVKDQYKTNFLVGILYCNYRLVLVERFSRHLYCEVDINAEQNKLLNIASSTNGQPYSLLLQMTLQKYSDQESIILFFQAMEGLFPKFEENDDVNQLNRDYKSMYRLGNVSEDQLTYTLARTSAVGSVLRKQLLPICEPKQHAANELLN